MHPGSGFFSRFKWLLLAAALGGSYYYLNNGRNATLLGGRGHTPSQKITGSGSLYSSMQGMGTGQGGGIGGVGGVQQNMMIGAGSSAEERTVDATPLIEAAAAGDKAKVVELLRQHMPVNGRDGDRRTALMGAAYLGHDEVCAQLLAAGANVQLQDRQGFNALDFAAARGLVKTVRLLLEKSDSKDHKQMVEYAQLMQAAFAYDVNLLPGKGKLASVNRVTPEGKSPLHVAAAGGAMDFANALIAGGANVNIPNADNQRPLHWAAWNNQIVMMALLIKHGAQVDAADSVGNTALIMATERGHKEAVALLLEQKANKKLRNKARENALDIAREKKLHEIAALLAAD